MFRVLVLKGLVGLHRTVQLQLPLTGWGIGLDYHDILWFLVGLNLLREVAL